jgi:UDP-N-acetylglucosamine--N-acetylmuramyl-(pentapeptide) pyrophosphoryl-undecaprenol N-acetylglucosamine transferase
LHEQNQDVGEANKKLEGYASKVFAVTGARGFNNPQKVTFLPLPVRAQFRKIAHYQPGKELKLLVLGGSQGAKRVNEAVSQMLPVIMRRGAHVVHQTGAADLERMKIAYGEYSGAHVVPFIDDVAGALEWADLIVSRAGAMSVAEISAAGRAAIYVPLAIAGAHQSANIKQVVERGAALHVPQDESLDRKLQAEVERLIDSVELRKEMAAKALELSLEGNVASEDVLARELLS